MPPIIEITNLSKQYRIGKREPYKTLRDTIVNTVTSPLRWFKVNEADEDNTRWALKDVSFEVNEGEVEHSVSNPEQVVPGDRKVLTVYWTSKIEKYWKGD